MLIETGVPSSDCHSTMTSFPSWTEGERETIFENKCDSTVSSSYCRVAKKTHNQFRKFDEKAKRNFSNFRKAPKI